MLICIETHITCDFPGGGGPDPIPPLDPHMARYSKNLKNAPYRKIMTLCEPETPINGYFGK